MEYFCWVKNCGMDLNNHWCSWFG